MTRGKHAASTAARRAHAESEAVTALEAEVKRLREALAEATRPIRTEHEDALSLSLAKACDERDMLKTIVRDRDATLARVTKQRNEIADSLAASLMHEKVGATIEVHTLLVELGYDTGEANRSYRRSSKKKQGVVNQVKEWRAAHPGA